MKTARITIFAAAGLLFVLPMNAQTESWDLAGFSRIDASAGVGVEFSTATQHSVTARFERGGRDDVEVKRDGDTLVLSRKSSWRQRNRAKVTFAVTAPALNAVEISSGAAMQASGIRSEEFQIDASSGASVEVSGSCGSVSVEASSGASVDAGDLVCGRAGVEASSGASVRVFASDAAEAEASSGASIGVAGAPPSRKKESSSGGSVSFEPREL